MKIVQESIFLWEKYVWVGKVNEKLLKFKIFKKNKNGMKEMNNVRKEEKIKRVWGQNLDKRTFLAHKLQIK